MIMDFFSSKRIWVDSTTYDKLDKLFQIRKGVVSREKIYRAIIYEWINNGGPTKVGDIILDKSIQKRYCIWILIEENLWDEFRYLCSIRGLDINIGFKIAVYHFVNLDEAILIQLFLY
jgi:hypothetical protein